MFPITFQTICSSTAEPQYAIVIQNESLVNKSKFSEKIAKVNKSKSIRNMSINYFIMFLATW